MNSYGICILGADATVGKGGGGFHLKYIFNALDVSEDHIASQNSRDHFVSSVWEDTCSFSALMHMEFFSCDCKIHGSTTLEIKCWKKY